MPSVKNKPISAPQNKTGEEKKDILIKPHNETDTEDEIDGLEKIEENDEVDDEPEDIEDDMEDEYNDNDAPADDTEYGDDGADCVYTGIGRRGGRPGSTKTTSNIERDDEDDEIILRNIGEVVPNDQRITIPHLTKYEMVRVIGDRTMQLTLGAKPMIKNTSNLNPRMIAQLELEARVIPIKIIRPLPDGRREIWLLSELFINRQYMRYEGRKQSN